MAQATAVSPSSLPFSLPSWSSRNPTLEVQTNFTIFWDCTKNADKNGRNL